MESAPVAFGDLLRRLRAAAAISQEELAARSGLSARGISDLGLLSLAPGESLAHLNYLVHRGEATVSLDDAGVAWYQSTTNPS